MDDVTKNRLNLDFPFFAKHRKTENSRDYNFLFFRFRLNMLKAEKSKNRKYPQVYSIFAFLRLLGITEKWKMDKNILVSHKEDFSNFFIYLKIRKMEK